MIHVEVTGCNGRDVVLLHGCPTPPEHMRGLAERLGRSCRVSVVHLPGYGRSPTPLGPYTVDDVSERIEAALADLGLRDAAAVGYSTGAYRALLLAVRRRLNWKAVVSLGGFASLDPGWRDAYLSLANAVRGGADLREALVELVLPPDRASRNPDVVREVQAWLGCIAADALALELESFARAPDLLEALGSLQVPVLARVGELDQAQPPVKSQAIVSSVPRGELQIVPGVAHDLLFGDMPGTADAILAFFARCA